MSVKSRIVRLEGTLQVQVRLDADRDARFRELSQQGCHKGRAGRQGA